MEATYTMAEAVLGSLSSTKKIDFEKQKRILLFLLTNVDFPNKKPCALALAFLVNKKKVVIFNILVTYLITIVSILLQPVLPNKKRTPYRCLRSN